jgi:transcriptional regulator with XRE-family HTH domain
MVAAGSAWTMSEARQGLTARTCAQARSLIGWTQRDLAKRSGLSTQTIRTFEADVRRPRYDTTTALLRAFQAAGVTFFFGADDQAGCALSRGAARPQRSNSTPCASGSVRP